jgi:hypothetical protein
MSKEFCAHSVEGKPVRQWQGLEAHLLSVAEPAYLMEKQQSLLLTERFFM